MSHDQIDPLNYPRFFPIIHYIPGTYMSHGQIDPLNYSEVSPDTTVPYDISINPQLYSYIVLPSAISFLRETSVYRLNAVDVWLTFTSNDKLYVMFVILGGGANELVARVPCFKRGF